MKDAMPIFVLPDQLDERSKCTNYVTLVAMLESTITSITCECISIEVINFYVLIFVCWINAPIFCNAHGVPQYSKTMTQTGEFCFREMYVFVLKLLIHLTISK